MSKSQSQNLTVPTWSNNEERTAPFMTWGGTFKCLWNIAGQVYCCYPFLS